MANFDFMDFEGGCDGVEFVVHARKFTKEEAVEKCLFENSHRYGGNTRTPNVSDVEEAYVKYYVKCPEWCGYEVDGGCYTYCSEGVRGSFPVWVIKLDKMEG